MRIDSWSKFVSEAYWTVELEGGRMNEVCHHNFILLHSSFRLSNTSVLLGEQSASKTDAWGSNPHARAAVAAADCRRGSTEKGVRLAVFFLWGKHAGANPVVGSLICPDGVADCIGLSEGPGPGSSPGRDTHNLPCECGGCMTVFEAVGRGSIPRRGTELFVPGV